MQRERIFEHRGYRISIDTKHVAISKRRGDGQIKITRRIFDRLVNFYASVKQGV
jgi:hypothetical protein